MKEEETIKKQGWSPLEQCHEHHLPPCSQIRVHNGPIKGALAMSIPVLTGSPLILLYPIEDVIRHFAQ